MAETEQWFGGSSFGICRLAACVAILAVICHCFGFFGFF